MSFGAKLVDMNKIDKLLDRTVNTSSCQYGLQILHCCIRWMELVLHVSYRISFKKWMVKTDSQKSLMENTSKRIQDDIREELGLLVDCVKQGNGFTNDENTARKFFKNYVKIAEITHFNEDLLKKFYVILQTLSSGREVNVDRFRQYSLEKARRYVREYEWYYMPSFLHKVLLHDAEIMESLVIPIGQTSEDVIESRHKEMKRARENSTRKKSRQDTNEDLIHFLLVTSDPYISSLRTTMLKKEEELLPQAEELLEIT